MRDCLTLRHDLVASVMKQCETGCDSCLCNGPDYVVLPFSACTAAKLTCSDALIQKCSVWLCSKHCGGQASPSVVLLKAGYRDVGLELPLHLYQYINSTGGGHFIAYVHRVVSATTPEQPYVAWMISRP